MKGNENSNNDDDQGWHQVQPAARAKQTQQQNNSNKKAQLPPLFITIGPPCSGKSTLLYSYNETNTNYNNKIKDITLDDQRLVYVKVPTKFFLSNNQPNLSSQNTWGSNNTSNLDISYEERQLLLWKLQNKFIINRIYDTTQNELRLILQRFKHIISKEEFYKRIMQIYTLSENEEEEEKNNNNSSSTATKTTAGSGGVNIAQAIAMAAKDDENTNNTTNINTQQHNKTTRTKSQKEINQEKYDNDVLAVGHELIKAVEEEMIQQQQQKQQLPEKIELFVVESIFRPYETKNNYYNKTALDCAHDELLKWCSASSDDENNYYGGGVAWGNTNTRPREYVSALEIAEKTDRPVHFIMMMSNDKKNRIIQEATKEVPSLLSSSNGQEGDNNDDEDKKDDADDIKDLDDVINNHDDDDDVFTLPLSSDKCFLPHVNLQTLLRRNIKRLLQTGKYIPAKSIFDSSCRADNLMNMSIRELDRQYNIKNAHIATARTTATDTNKDKESTTTANNNDDSMIINNNGTSMVDVVDDQNQNDENTTTTTRIIEEQEEMEEGKEHQEESSNSMMTEEILPIFTKFDLDCTLAKFANYKMNNDRTVCKIDVPGVQNDRKRSVNDNNRYHPQQQQRRDYRSNNAQQHPGRGWNNNNYHRNSNGTNSGYYGGGRNNNNNNSNNTRTYYQASRGEGGYRGGRGHRYDTGTNNNNNNNYTATGRGSGGRQQRPGQSYGRNQLFAGGRGGRGNTAPRYGNNSNS